MRLLPLMHRVRTAPCAGVLLLLYPALAGAAPYGQAQVAAQGASQQTALREPERASLSATALSLLDLFRSRPEILVEVKAWIADRVSHDGVNVLASSITDEQLFTRVNMDPELRSAIAIHLEARGYRDVLRERDTRVAPSPRGAGGADGGAAPPQRPLSQSAGSSDTMTSASWEAAFRSARDLPAGMNVATEESLKNGRDPFAAFVPGSEAAAREAGAALQSGLLPQGTSSLARSEDIQTPDLTRSATSRRSSSNATRSVSGDTASDAASPEVLHEETPYNLLALRDLYASLAAESRPLERFGSSVFATEDRAQDAALDQPVGPSYVLGPGDVLRLGISGSLAQTLQRSVDSAGRVAVPEIGMVQVAGLTLEQAERLLEQRLSGQLRHTGVDLSVTRLRSVRVYVVGDVREPGAYLVHSLSTPLNALLAAGGPSASGSYRTLEHLRAGKLIETVDLYDLLLKGSLHPAEPLREGDTIRIPPAGLQVEVAGRVRRPAVYELTPGATLHDAVELAGGLLPDAQAAQAILRRIDATGQRQTIAVTIAELGPGGAMPARDGDALRIGAVAPWSESNVYVEGHFVRPGRKALSPGMTLHDVLSSYRELLPEPAERGELIRLAGPERKPVSLPFSVRDAVEGRAALALQPFDTIRVRGRYELDAPRVTVRGEVQRPGDYPLSENMTVSALVELAGGFTRSALLSEADLASYQVSDGRAVTSERATLAVGAIVEHQAGVVDTPLKPGDVLTVHQISGWKDIGASVRLEGEFVYPGTFGLQPGERLSSVLRRAGGFRSTAYPAGAMLLRTQVREFEERTRLELIHQIESTSVSSRLGVNASGQDQSGTLQLLIQQQEQVLQRLRTQHATGRMVVHLSEDISSWQGSSADIELRAGDVLVLPKRPGFVLVSGQVYNQSAQTFTPNKRAEWYLQHAGGATDMAEIKEIFIVRANGEVIGRRSNGGYDHVLKTKLDAGDVIVVPQKIVGGSVFWRNMLTTAQLFSSIAIPLAIAGI